MTDPRLTPSNGRVAHVSFQGRVAAERFVEGTPTRVVALPCADLLDTPGGTRQRQLPFGEPFVVLETRDAAAFGFAVRDSYTGWVHSDAVEEGAPAPTHRVSAARAVVLPRPDVKSAGQDFAVLGLGARVRVEEEQDGWSRVHWPGPGGNATRFIRTTQISDIDRPEADPVSVAEAFLGTPYLWGGNTALGIDCSGLVQESLLACGIDCPGDSDLQEAALGQPLEKDAGLRRGDLLFWKGHVAFVASPRTLIHANAHHMAVAVEPVDAAIARIAASDGPVTARRRLG